MELIKHITSFAQNAKKRSRSVYYPPWSAARASPEPTFDLNVIPTHMLECLKSAIDEELTKRNTAQVTYLGTIPPHIQSKIEAIAMDADKADQHVRDTVGKEVERIHLNVRMIANETIHLMEFDDAGRLVVPPSAEYEVQKAREEILEEFVQGLHHIQAYNKHFKGTAEEYIPKFEFPFELDLSSIQWVA